MNLKVALIFGASGLVGSHCLQELLLNSNYGKVIAFTRRSLGISHPKFVEVIIDFNSLDDIAHTLVGDDLFYCMGSTLKKAGSQQEFRKIDLNYPLSIATIAAKNGVKKWIMVSSVGASKSATSFYLRVKGEAEYSISTLGFQEIHFFRPSLLLGERAEHRIAESLGKSVMRLLSPIMVGALKKLRPVEASRVANEMVVVAQSCSPGINIH